jgi:hypothetical protein
MYCIISSAGEIDPLALTLLGASTKRDDNEKIGFFGSGNKYALAYLLREKIEFCVFQGVRELPISTEPVEFRGQTFNRLVIGGIPTGITAETGPKWDLLDVVREFWSNALDEGEAQIVFNDRICVTPVPGRTTIYIRHLFMEGLSENWPRYFAANQKVLAKTDTGAIIDKSTTAGQLSIMRRGVFVDKDNAQSSSLFSYNFVDIPINEARKADYWDILFSVGRALMGADESVFKVLIANMNNEKLIEIKALNIISINTNSNFGVWLRERYQFVYTTSMIPNMPDTHRQIGLPVGDTQLSIFKNVLASYPDWLRKCAISTAPIPREHQPRVDRVLQEIRSFEIPKFRLEFPILIDTTLTDERVLAYADGGTCYLNKSLFTVNRDMLFTALLEEAMHIDLGLTDFSRAMQNTFHEIIVHLTKANRL